MEINQLLESIKVEEFENMVIVYDLESHCQRLFESLIKLDFQMPEAKSWKLEAFTLFLQNQIKNKAQYMFQKPVTFTSLRASAKQSRLAADWIASATPRNNVEIYKLRLIYSKDARFSIAIEPYTRDLSKEWQVKILSPEEFQINSKDPQWKHKFYPRPRIDLQNYDEVIWTNENGHICEGSFTNIFFQDNSGNWHTPHLNCGILPGTMRANLIQGLGATEGFYLTEQLPKRLLLVNSMFIKEVNPYQQA